MDIKSKKWKTIISFTAFAVGTGLLVQGVSSLINFSGRGFDRLREAESEDYQQTSEFKWYMSDKMNELIYMGTGENFFNLYNNDYYGRYGDDFWNMYEEGLVQEAAASEGTVSVTEDRNEVTVESGMGLGIEYEDGEWNNDAYSSYNSHIENSVSGEEMAERLHEYMKNDKNILYSVSKDGKELFTNAEGYNWQDKENALKEGYNFLMYFDGEKVSVFKDCNEIDIYGDGTYREEEDDWRVPGYRNFVSGEKAPDVSVRIAAAADPVNYISGSSLRNESRLYWIQENLRSDQRSLDRIITSLAASIIILALYLALRRDKKPADEAIAHFTGKLWFELKAAFVISVLLMLAGSYYLFWGEEYFSIWQVMEVFRQIFGTSAGLLVLFWTVYLIVIDLKYNPGSWRNGLCMKLAGLLSEKERKLPIVKRTMRRYKIALLAEAGFIAVFGAAVFLLARGSINNRKTLLLFAPPFVLFLLQFIYLRPNARTLRDMDLISEQIESIRSGNLSEGLELPGDAGLLGAAENLTDIQKGMKEAMDEQMKSERMKVELIANVSHDIKTPLTSIISYVELLRQEDNLPEHVKDYINILENKSQRLKTMIQDVFEVSKASSGQLPVSMEELDLGKLLRQTLADMGEQIEGACVTVKTDIPEGPVMIVADGQRLYRVFQNLVINSLKYSLEGSRVYITLTSDGSVAAASVKNTSQSEISGELDFTERFLRGDESRSDGGSGLGLSIAKSFTEACGGSFKVEAIADLFIVTVEFSVK